MYVFISYSSKDHKIAKRLEAELCRLGIDCFLDRKEISWGDDVVAKITAGIAACSSLIVIVSLDSVRSQWIPFEVGVATALGKRVLPFVTHPSIDLPAYLSRFHYKTRLSDIKDHFKPAA